MNISYQDKVYAKLTTIRSFNWKSKAGIERQGDISRQTPRPKLEVPHSPVLDRNDSENLLVQLKPVVVAADQSSGAC
ncbi:hypothetical protein QQP08_002557 [Theobroma cacao]|nr:hypothetical protein QQP08_002557 [Theobroma cacao]